MSVFMGLCQISQDAYVESRVRRACEHVLVLCECVCECLGHYMIVCQYVLRVCGRV